MLKRIVQPSCTYSKKCCYILCVYYLCLLCTCEMCNRATLKLLCKNFLMASFNVEKAGTTQFFPQTKYVLWVFKLFINVEKAGTAQFFPQTKYVLNKLFVPGNKLIKQKFINNFPSYKSVSDSTSYILPKETGTTQYLSQKLNIANNFQMCSFTPFLLKHYFVTYIMVLSVYILRNNYTKVFFIKTRKI